MSLPRILVTNDDGVFSKGIERLAAALAPVGEVFTVAPDQERSAAGHSLTLQSPLRAKLVGENRWSVDGTPTDCVNWGVLHLMKDERPRLIFSGINLGLNLGDDVTYSGTVVNVNVPAGPVNGVRVARLGKRRYGETVIEKTDPRGRPYFWIGSTIPTGDAEEGTDILAIAEKYISMSPLHLDLTDYRSMEVLEEIARGIED